MSSPFDPKTFQSMTFTESNSTESVPIPVGEWPASCSKADITTWQSKDGSKAGLKLTLMWEIEAPEVSAVTGRQKNSVKDEIMLDLTETGMLDFGKGMNVKLGQRRAAVGLNTPGQPFAFDMFIGRGGKVAVKHRALDDGRLVADCAGVTAAN